MKILRPYLIAGITVLMLFSAQNASAYSAADKSLRGLAGMTTSVLEIPGNMVKESNAQGPAIGIPTGLAIGLGMTVTRTLVGVYEFLSAPFPVPAGFRPILTPEYPWDYFK